MSQYIRIARLPVFLLIFFVLALPILAAAARPYEPGTAADIEALLQDEIEALRREYQVAGKRVNFYYVLHETPRPERRLLLRGQWKDDAALSRAQTAFMETYTPRRPR